MSSPAAAHQPVENLVQQLHCYGAHKSRVIQDVNNILRQTISLACQIGQLGTGRRALRVTVLSSAVD
jgi:hypothetical protein